MNVNVNGAFMNFSSYLFKDLRNMLEQQMVDQLVYGEASKCVHCFWLLMSVLTGVCRSASAVILAWADENKVGNIDTTWAWDTTHL